jgi:hypothetical protein
MPRRSPRREYRRRRPGPEGLEPRELLALSWTGAGGDGLWSTPANWDANRAPVAGDALVFPASATGAATDDLGLTLGGLQVDWPGSITLNRTLTVSGAFEQSGGTITGAGDLVLGGASSWSGGKMTGTGTTRVAAGAGLTLGGVGTRTLSRALDNAGLVALSGGTLDGAGTLTTEAGARLQWTGGAMTGTGTTAVAAGGSLQIDGPTNKLLLRAVDNAGTATWTGTGPILAGDGVAFTNEPGALFDAQTDANYDTANGGGGVFNNRGTFRKSAGAGTTALRNTTASSTLTFNNSGTIDVRTGTVAFQDGGSSSGPGNGLVLAAGAVAEVDGFFTLNGTAVTGAGTLRLVSGGILNISGTVSAPNVAQTGGTLTGDGHLRVTGQFQWSGGSMLGAGSTDIAAGATLAIVGPGAKGDLRNLNNSGTVTWSGAGTLSVGGAVIDNLPGGVWDIQADATCDTAGPSTTATFRNEGTLRKSAGAGTAAFQASSTGSSLMLANSGTVDVRSGTLRLACGLSNLSGPTLAGGTYSVATTLQLPGVVQADAATIVLDGPSAAILDKTGAPALGSLTSISTAGSLTVLGGSTLATGPLSNAGLVTVGSGSRLQAAGYTQSAGGTRVDGTLDAAAYPATFNAGTLAGAGLVKADVVNATRVEPGGSNAAGVLSVQGSYRQTAAGTLHVEIGGSQAGGQYDQLAVSGPATLGGTLDVGRLGGYMPAGRFTVLAASSAAGTFANWLGLALGNGRRLTPSLNGGALTLQVASAPPPGDYDGDGKTDTAVYDQTASQFLILKSGGGASTPQFGNPSHRNVPVAGDYDGDGKTDFAVYDQTASQFMILLSGGGALTPQFGNPTYVNIPIAGDFDGDGKTDLAIFDQTASQFFILLSGGGALTPQFGNPSHVNFPVAGDFDGDGKTDVGIYDQTTSQFFILLSGGGALTPQFGNPSRRNIPVAGDFNGDGKTDVGVYDQTASQFFILLSGGGALTPQFGNPAHSNVPVAGDYDGDGKTDIAVYDQTASQFFILLSGGGARTPQFGNPAHTNIPVPWGGTGGLRVRLAAAGAGSPAMPAPATEAASRPKIAGTGKGALRSATRARRITGRPALRTQARPRPADAFPRGWPLA